MDINSPLLTIMGLRARPADLTGAAREKWDALEPAWRLTHAVTLLQIHQKRRNTQGDYTLKHALFVTPAAREHVAEFPKTANPVWVQTFPAAG